MLKKLLFCYRGFLRFFTVLFIFKTQINGNLSYLPFLFFTIDFDYRLHKMLNFHKIKDQSLVSRFSDLIF